MTKQLRLALVLLTSAVSAFASDHTTVDALRNATTELMATLQADEAKLRADPELLHQAILPVVNSHFDMTRISRWVLGKNWRTMTPEQRGRFLGQFKRLIIRVYGYALLENLGSEISWKQLREDKNNAAVQATVKTKRGPIKIVFVLKTNPKEYDGYRVYDVKVEGVSLVTNYRTTFGRTIATEGADVLIEKLRGKNG